MKQLKLKPLPLLLCTAAIFPITTHAEEFKQHAAHEHGVAMLNLVQEKGQVMIELNTPAANLVGFEHQARTDEQKAAVEQAHEQLERDKELFVFSPEAGCKANKIKFEAEIFGNGHGEHKEEYHGHDDHHEKHDEHEADHHDKDEGHQHARHEDHEDHEDHHEYDHHDHHSESSHSDVVANYTFSCTKPSAINYADIMLFKVFPGFERINAQVVSGRGQQALELSASNYRVSF